MNRAIDFATAESHTPPEEADGRATYSIAEVGLLLGLCPSTTYKRVREGAIPALRMGGRWIVPKRRFHAWLDSQAAGQVL